MAEMLPADRTELPRCSASLSPPDDDGQLALLVSHASWGLRGGPLATCSSTTLVQDVIVDRFPTILTPHRILAVLRSLLGYGEPRPDEKVEIRKFVPDEIERIAVGSWGKPARI